MKFLRRLLDKQAKHFEKGGIFEKVYPLWEASDTFIYTPGHVTKVASHVRDGLDLKRMMTIVVIALLPCVFMAVYNTGYQANLALNPETVDQLRGWRHAVLEGLGVGYSPNSFLACIIHGALYFLPIVVVTYAAGGACETLFACVRKHEINEGFLVTGILFPLILPPTTPLWQVALGVTFGVVVGKEIFGGTGRNILNPALTARAFLFFAYPAEISGDKVWVAVPPDPSFHVDGFSGATWLARAAYGGQEAVSEGLGWWDAFVGTVPGSMGETSALFCLIGAAVLIFTRVGSWRIMASVVVGSFVMCVILNLIGSDTNPFFGMPFYWHWVLGGFAFAAVFMATDPVSSAFTERGKVIYGFLIGVLGILIRVINPAYPEGWMLAILFMNMFAPLIDHFIVEANIKRRMARYAA